jgi:hypothetical protein
MSMPKLLHSIPVSISLTRSPMKETKLYVNCLTSDATLSFSNLLIGKEIVHRSVLELILGISLRDRLQVEEITYMPETSNIIDDSECISYTGEKYVYIYCHL